MINKRMKTNERFNKIHELIKWQDRFTGLFLFQKFNSTSIGNWIAKIICIGTYLIEINFILSSFTSGKLILMILEGIVIVILIVIFTGLNRIHSEYGHTSNLFDFCEKLYINEGHFKGNKMQFITKRHVDRLYQKTILTINLMITIFYFDAILFVIALPFLESFLPGTILIGKYQLPTPFELWFFRNNQWISTAVIFYVTLFAQFFACLQILSTITLLASFLIIFVLHFFTNLDIINECIDLMKAEMLQFVKLRQDAYDMTEWTKILVTSLSNFHNILNCSFTKIFKILFLGVEFAGFAAFLMFGLVFLVLKESRILGVGGLAADLIFFVTCVMIEKILDKLEKIYQNLYDCPWYELSVKEQKIFLMIMNGNFVPVGFSAMGIHNLTLERFAKVAKSAYSNVLVLRDIIKKF